MKKNTQSIQVQLIQARIENLENTTPRHEQEQTAWPLTQITSVKVLQTKVEDKALKIQRLHEEIDQDYLSRCSVKLGLALGGLGIALGFICAGIFSAQGWFGDYAMWSGFGIGFALMAAAIGIAHLISDALAARAEREFQKLLAKGMPIAPEDKNFVC